jgi:hypothetical protein
MATHRAKKVGRPRGKTKSKLTCTMDSKLMSECKKIAAKNGYSFSAWIEMAAAEKKLTSTSP